MTDPFEIPAHLVAKYARLRLNEAEITLEERLYNHSYEDLLTLLAVAGREQLPATVAAIQKVLLDFIPWRDSA